MNTNLLTKYAAYAEAQSRRSRVSVKRTLPVITISREVGAGAVTIANLVAELLDARSTGKSACPWTVFDRNLVEQVLQDHDLPERIKSFMPEDSRSDLKDAVEEMLGLHPSDWTLVEHTTDTILRLARLGNAIIVGRGGNVITARLRAVFHVRLVGPLDARIAHVQKFYSLEEKEAAQFVRATDRARRRYVKRYFGASIDDPLQYHVTLNTGLMSFEEAARLIADAIPAPEADRGRGRGH